MICANKTIHNQQGHVCVYQFRLTSAPSSASAEPVTLSHHRGTPEAAIKQNGTTKPLELSLKIWL